MMAVGGISHFINPVIDGIVSERRTNESHTFVVNRDTVPIKVLAIGDENCQKDQLLMRCAYNTSHLDVKERFILKRHMYSDICTQLFNVQCQLQLLDTCEC